MPKLSKMPISVLILAKNEQDMIEDCLKQLDFAEEIIILDQKSNDKTVEIAKKYTYKIFASPNDDFGKNRTLLSEYAKGDWLLYLDCDERLSKENLDEIALAIIRGKNNAYYFPRKNFILGKEVRHGGWWPDYVPRLFKKSALSKWYGRVHESPKIEGEFGYMKNPITHLTARNIEMMLEKSIKWAKIEAELYNKTNTKQVNIPKVAKSIIFEFFLRYFIKKGILDGVVGLVEAIFQSLHKAVILTYLWEIQNNTLNKRPNYE